MSGPPRPSRDWITPILGNESASHLTPPVLLGSPQDHRDDDNGHRYPPLAARVGLGWLLVHLLAVMACVWWAYDWDHENSWREHLAKAMGLVLTFPLIVIAMLASPPWDAFVAIVSVFLTPILWSLAAYHAVGYFLVRRFRSRDPLAVPCPACGYDLRASPTRCPECGHIVGPA
jgi:hypothetical protein